MLLSYKVKNFCSFAEEAEFDLLAPGNRVKNRFPDNYVQTEQGFDILKTAVIIGENAGGKTNFIESLGFLKMLFRDNEVKHSYKSLINVNNLSPEQSDTRQSFDICVLGGSGTIYHYSLEIDKYSIVKERLAYKKTKGDREKEVFSIQRYKLKVNENSVEASLETKISHSKIKDLLSEQKHILTDENISLVATRLAILGDEHAMEFVDWINNKLNVETRPINYFVYKSMKNEEDDLRIIQDQRFLDILKMVDYSIDKIEVDEEKPFSETKVIRRMADGGTFARELKRDSAGVREFFAWAVQLFKVVYENKIVFADEMDRVINPILSERIVAYVNGKEHRGQFVFSTHNALHLDLRNYMKEQIYFVTKERDNLNSELYSLADFPEVRYETAKIYEFYTKGILGGTAFE